MQLKLTGQFWKRSSTKKSYMDYPFFTKTDSLQILNGDLILLITSSQLGVHHCRTSVNYHLSNTTVTIDYQFHKKCCWKSKKKYNLQLSSRSWNESYSHDKNRWVLFMHTSGIYLASKVASFLLNGKKPISHNS